MFGFKTVSEKIEIYNENVRIVRSLIRSMYNKGYSIRQISKKLGIKKRRVKKYLKE